MKQTLYEILDVSSNASEAAIKVSYERMRERYADMEKTDAAVGDNLKLLTLAYEVIVDPTQRAMYDQRMARQELINRQPPPETDAAGAPPVQSELTDEKKAGSFLTSPWFIICAGIVLLSLAFLVGRRSKPSVAPPAPVKAATTKALVN